MFVLGDAIGRRFFTFVSIPHRAASAFLCGLLLSSWWTYTLAYFCSNATSPMLWGNLLFFITAIGLILWLNQNPAKEEPPSTLDLSDAHFQKWDWIITGIFFLFVTWMMFQTLTMGNGNLLIGHHQNADFGSTLSIMQSFALGHNFPTEYTHFTGERIRYHFLFYFQAGNLEYLGLSPVIANNLLSVFSLTTMLVLVMTLGGVLFRSRVAGRIGAALFFVHGSLSYIPFLLSQPSFSNLLNDLNTMTSFLKSGFPYRGEAWGVWSLNVFLNQRHLASAIAIFLLILIYIVIRLRENSEAAAVEAELLAAEAEILKAEVAQEESNTVSEETEASESEIEPLSEKIIEDVESDDELDEDEDWDEDDEDSDDDDGEDEEEEDENEFSLTDYIKENSVVVFCGLLLGLLPMWNGAIFLGAAVVLAALILLFPKFRRELLTLAITAAIVALPQIIYLKTGHVKPANYSMLRWGFIIDDAGIFDLLWWTFYTFGFKWILLGIAIYFSTGWQRRLLAAVSFLIPLTYCFRFSVEVLANHKFINLWLVVVNVYCGFAVIKLWNLKAGKSVVPSRIAAVVLLLLIIPGGLIDLMPIKNSDNTNLIRYKWDDNKLINWVKENTDPKSIFLSHKYINHEFLLAGRRLFYGDPYYAWGTDYDTEEREKIVKIMLESKDPNQVFALLKENNINYVAIDDQIRNTSELIKNPTEEVFAKYFELVFSDDTADFGGHMKIYKVPEALSGAPSSAPPENTSPENANEKPSPEGPAANIFQGGGEGSLPGQFKSPRGLAVDSKGFIYVADYFNARVQKFAPDGKFILAFGTKGEDAGQFKEPNSVVVDESGSVYVTDGLAHKLLKFDADGKFIKEWAKPGVDFYGARDLAIGPNKKLYIVDQGHTNITVFDPATFDPATDKVTTWGSNGSGDGQFNESTGIGIGANMVFVADRDNHRIEVFDLDGKFIRQWPIEGWERFHYPDVVYDEATKHVYVSDGKSNQILVFDVEGHPLPALKTDNEIKFDNPSAMVISESGKQRRLFILNTSSGRVSTIELEAKKAEAIKGK